MASKEVCDLFKGKLITEKVESLCIPEDYYFEDDLVNYSNIFKRMQSLETLIVGDGAFSTNCTITSLPSSLRVIVWSQYPSISLPESFEPSQLVVLCLPESRLVELWPKSKKLSNLKHLNLGDSCELTKTRNFGDMPNLETWIRSLPPSLSGLRMLQLDDYEILESIPDTIRNLSRLYISGCNKLATLPNNLFESQQLEHLEIHQCSGLVKLPISLRVQKKLCLLKIDRCENLKKLPSSIQMESLFQLEISNSPKLDTFPEIKGDIHYLKYLILESTGIREVPSSIGNLLSLTSLNLSGCEDLVSLPDSICNLMNLQLLHLYRCKKLEKLPENMGDLQELCAFDVRKTAIYQPPPSITKLGKLKYLGLTGLLEDLGSFHNLERLSLSGSNISCLPKSLKGLLHLQDLYIQFCQKLNELPSGERPPNLVVLLADYHLALKSIRDLVINYPHLRMLRISNCGAVSSEQVDVFLQHFLRTCIQCDFHQRDYFLISFPGVRIPELFDYDRFINQKGISNDLNPSWYTDKFMGFLICYGPVGIKETGLETTLVCKSDPERKYSLKYIMHRYFSLEYPFICCVYIPFETLWNGSGNKEGKNPNDYYMLMVSHMLGNSAGV